MSKFKPVSENNSLSGIIGDKIFNKEIQVKMLPHVTVFQVCRAYYCLFVCGVGICIEIGVDVF